LIGRLKNPGFADLETNVNGPMKEGMEEWSGPPGWAVDPRRGAQRCI